MDYAAQGLAIRSARLSRNMTQAHLALASGVSEKTVRRAESGGSVRADNARALCSALGLDAAAVLGPSRCDPPGSISAPTQAHPARGVPATIVYGLAAGCLAAPLLALHLDLGPQGAAMRGLGLAWCALVAASVLYLVAGIPGVGTFLRSMPGAGRAGRFLGARQRELVEVSLALATPAMLGLAGHAAHRFLSSPTAQGAFDACAAAAMALQVTRAAAGRATIPS